MEERWAYEILNAPEAKKVPSSNEVPEQDVTSCTSVYRTENLTDYERDVSDPSSPDSVTNGLFEEHAVGVGEPLRS